MKNFITEKMNSGGLTVAISGHKQPLNKSNMDMKNFITEKMNSGGLTVAISGQVAALCDEYRLMKSSDHCSIITGEFGRLGSLNIKELSADCQELVFKYESGSYDYVSTRTNSSTNILWTDYQDIEPYNRQGGLYADGASFKSLGAPVLEKSDCREFHATHVYQGNISFAVWGFRFNDFYNSINFGICIKTDQVGVFITRLRLIIGK